MKNKCIILIPAYEPDYNLIELVKNINKNDYDIIVIDDIARPLNIKHPAPKVYLYGICNEYFSAYFKP